MDLGLKGRTALVTGGAAGIGAAIALELAREGCDVAIVDVRRDEKAEATLAGDRGRGRARRSTRRTSVTFRWRSGRCAKVAAAAGRLDVLVCCAGVTDDALSWKMTEAQWDRVLDVNLKGCFAYCRAARAHEGRARAAS